MSNIDLNSLQERVDRFVSQKKFNKRSIKDGIDLMLELRTAGSSVVRLQERILLTQLARDTSEKIFEVTGEYYSAKLDTPSALVADEITSTVGGAKLSGDEISDEKVFSTPLRALHQLRAPISDFIGREYEITKLVQMLKTNSDSGAMANISGIRGMGGIGKTELAHKVAQLLTDTFTDAQIVIELRGASQNPLLPEQALKTIIHSFDRELALPDNLTQLQSLYRSILNGKKVLILADDAKDALQVRALMPPSGCALLITSRNRFSLPGIMTIDLQTLPQREAELLLLEIYPQIGEHATELAQLCGYLPLALRLSASLLANNSSSIERYMERLRTERLENLLDLDNPDDPQVSIKKSIQLSYELLDASVQQLLCQLSIFVTAFDVLAAKAVTTVDGDVELHLDVLRRRSLLNYDLSLQRYSLHELVRIFALEKLPDNDEYTARLRHAAHYIQVAEAAEQQFLAGGAAITAGLALFDREQAQLDAARAWLHTNTKGMGKDNAEIDDLLIADAYATAHIGDLRYPKRTALIPQLETALAAAQRRGRRDAQSAFLGNLGLAYAALGAARRAIDFYQQNLAIARELGDRRGEGAALGNLGNAYAALGEARRGIDFYQRHLAIARELGDRRGEGAALGNLGLAYAALGEARRAIDFYQQNLAITREIGDRRGEGAALGNLGIAYADLGEARRAIDFYQQHLALTREIGDRRGEGAALGNLGNAYAALGEARRAIDFYQQHLALARELGDRRGEGAALGNLGIAYAALGEARRATDFYQQRIAIAREIGDRRGEGNALGNLGNAYAALGEARRAIDFYQQHLAITRELGDRQGEAETSWNYGLALVRESQPAAALALLEASLAFFRAIGHPRASSMHTTIEHVREHGALPTTPAPDDIPRDELLAGLPTPVREAIQRGDGAALQAALDSLQPDAAAAIVAQLRQAGIIGAQDGPDMARVLREFAPLLQAIAAVARGDETQRIQVEQLLPQLEQGGWQIAEPVRRIWASERDAHALSEGIDANSAQLIQRVLELLDTPEAELPPLDDQLATLPESVRAALAQSDPAALQAALDALPPEQRAQAEQMLQELQQHVIAQVAEQDPRQLLSALPESVQQALEHGDEPALRAALEALPGEQRQMALATLAQLQLHQQLAAQPQPQGDPRQRFAPLLRDIASVAAGDEGPRANVEAQLERMQAAGWMLRELVQRIWAGERDAQELTHGLDEQDTALVEHILALIGDYERGERHTPAQILGALPEPVRVALQQQDEAAFNEALAALPEDERSRVLELLAPLAEDALAPLLSADPEALRAGLPDTVRWALDESSAALQAALAALPDDQREAAATAIATLQARTLAQLPAALREAIEQNNASAFQDALTALPAEEANTIQARLRRAGILGAQRGPDIHQVVQNFLPLLGDIALAAHGDLVARALAEALLAALEQHGWRIAEPTRRIWAGERNAAALTEGLDAQDTALIERTLRLVADGPNMIFVAGSLQIAELRRRTSADAERTLASGDASQRAELAARLEELAQQAEAQIGDPWRELAEYLRTLVAQIRS